MMRHTASSLEWRDNAPHAPAAALRWISGMRVRGALASFSSAFGVCLQVCAAGAVALGLSLADAKTVSAGELFRWLHAIEEAVPEALKERAPTHRGNSWPARHHTWGGNSGFDPARPSIFIPTNANGSGIGVGGNLGGVPIHALWSKPLSPEVYARFAGPNSSSETYDLLVRTLMKWKEQGWERRKLAFAIEFTLRTIYDQGNMATTVFARVDTDGDFASGAVRQSTTIGQDSRLHVTLGVIRAVIEEFVREIDVGGSDAQRIEEAVRNYIFNAEFGRRLSQDPDAALKSLGIAFMAIHQPGRDLGEVGKFVEKDGSTIRYGGVEAKIRRAMQFRVVASVVYELLTNLEIKPHLGARVTIYEPDYDGNGLIKIDGETGASLVYSIDDGVRVTLAGSTTISGNEQSGSIGVSWNVGGWQFWPEARVDRRGWAGTTWYLGVRGSCRWGGSDVSASRREDSDRPSSTAQNLAGAHEGWGEPGGAWTFTLEDLGGIPRVFSSGRPAIEPSFAVRRSLELSVDRGAFDSVQKNAEGVPLSGDINIGVDLTGDIEVRPSGVSSYFSAQNQTLIVHFFRDNAVIPSGSYRIALEQTDGNFTIVTVDISSGLSIIELEAVEFANDIPLKEAQSFLSGDLTLQQAADEAAAIGDVGDDTGEGEDDTGDGGTDTGADSLPTGAPTGLALAAASDGGTQGDNLTNDTTPTFEVTSLGTGATYMQYRVNGGGWIDVSVGVTSFEISGPGDGDHTVEVRSVNGAGTWPSSSLDFTIDSTPAEGVGWVWGDSFNEKGASIGSLSYTVDDDVIAVSIDSVLGVTIDSVDFSWNTITFQNVQNSATLWLRRIILSVTNKSGVESVLSIFTTLVDP